VVSLVYFHHFKVVRVVAFSWFSGIMNTHFPGAKTIVATGLPTNHFYLFNIIHVLGVFYL
jgi:hypothetical protein